MELNLLVVGTVRNIGENLETQIEKFENILRDFGNVSFYIVESDSADHTLRVLNSIQAKKSNFKFESFGNLSKDYPNRVDRIRYCRNGYVTYIRKEIPKFQWDYVIVVDFDGMNNSLSQSGIRTSLFSAIDWDGCFANQQFGYYDIYALRARNWVEEDCFQTLEKLKMYHPFRRKFSSEFLNNLHAIRHFDKMRYLAIYSKMKRLPLKSPWVQVDSAFGGFAIYRAEIFLESDYSPKAQSNFTSCEHVDFHLSAIGMGAKFFINPRLINNRINEYNLNRLVFIRYIRELKKFYPILGKFIKFKKWN